MGRGGSVYADFQCLTIMQVSDRILSTSMFTPAELDSYLSVFYDPTFV